MWTPGHRTNDTPISEAKNPLDEPIRKVQRGPKKHRNSGFLVRAEPKLNEAAYVADLAADQNITSFFLVTEKEVRPLKRKVIFASGTGRPHRRD